MVQSQRTRRHARSGGSWSSTSPTSTSSPTSWRDGVNVPSDVQQYVNNPQYFLFCISNCQTGAQIPYGAFYTFLQQVGGGPQLARLEQVYNQLTSGIIHNYSYILAATMDTTDYPGFEALSFTDATVLAMQFMPVTVSGQTIYAPIDPFAS